MDNSLIVPDDLNPGPEVLEKAKDFLVHFKSHEIAQGAKLVLYLDKKSGAYYLVCHLSGEILASHCDLEATIDGSKEDEIYKLNRDITEDKAAYIVMEEDAISGRSFEDLVIEYDTSYVEELPFKIYGGQHRVRAITRAKKQGVNEAHGVRVYFDLLRDQKVEIATISNTSIAVSNDLLDRMREQMTGPELRIWCQTVGLLDKREDFADRRSAEVPTVQIVRTLIVNFYLGMEACEDDLHQPALCRSGGMDEEYLRIRARINWSDEGLIEMGKQFSRLNTAQRQAVLGRENDSHAQYARRAFSFSVVAGWAYAAGFFQGNVEHLKNHYALSDEVEPPDDPLNAKALSQARLQGVDPDTYRGLGTRSDMRERGRMLEVFLVQATRGTRRRITKKLANAAIKSYVAKRATSAADKALGRI